MNFTKQNLNLPGLTTSSLSLSDSDLLLLKKSARLGR